jgi:hypothetical protein
MPTCKVRLVPSRRLPHTAAPCLLATLSFPLRARRIISTCHRIAGLPVPGRHDADQLARVGRVPAGAGLQQKRSLLPAVQSAGCRFLRAELLWAWCVM